MDTAAASATRVVQNAVKQQAFTAETEQAHRDLRRALAYVTQRHLGDRLSPSSLAEAEEICSKPFPQLSHDERLRVWGLLDQFSKAIEPATLDGLRAVASDGDGAGISPSLKYGMIASLVLTLALQFYTLFGAQTLRSIDNKIEKMSHISSQMAQIERASLHDVSDNVEFKQLATQLKDIDYALGFDYQSLYQWNSLWAAPVSFFSGKDPDFYWGYECAPARRGCDLKSYNPALHQVKYGTEQIARSLVDNFKGMLVPLCFGMLGAWVWLLRERLAQIHENRLTRVVPGEYAQRILLGAVLGSITGYFSNVFGGGLSAVPLAGLAFLVGYNVESIMQSFDRLLSPNEQRTNKTFKGVTPKSSNPAGG